MLTVYLEYSVPCRFPTWPPKRVWWPAIKTAHEDHVKYWVQYGRAQPWAMNREKAFRHVLLCDDPFEAEKLSLLCFATREKGVPPSEEFLAKLRGYHYLGGGEGGKKRGARVLQELTVK